MSCVRSGRECVYSQRTQKSKVKVLEDRLIQLEKRLEQPTGMATSTPGPTSTAGSGLLPSPVEAGDPDQWNPSETPFHPSEPDLMALADAAAIDSTFPWEGLNEEQIVLEIASATEGQRAIATHIIQHL